MDTNTNKNTPNGPTKVNPVMTPNVQAQENQKIPANKMSKVDKIRIWAGIGFMAFVLIFVLGLLIIPRVIEPCCLFSSYSHLPLCDNRVGGYNFWLLASFFLGVPLNITGGSFILRGISNWGGMKHPGFIMFLVVVLNILLPVLLVTCIR